MLNKIKENKEINKKVDPFALFVFSKVLNSVCNLIKILFHIIKWRLGINQNINGINIIPKNALNQLNDKLKMLVEGSKIENKFAIIFNLNYFFLI